MPHLWRLQDVCISVSKRFWQTDVISENNDVR